MRPLIKLIKPDLYEFMLYMAMGLVLLLISGYGMIYQYYANGLSAESVLLNNNFALMVQQRILGLESLIDPRIADFTAWLVIGFISVGVILLAQNTIEVFEEEATNVRLIRNKDTKKRQIIDDVSNLGVRLSGIFLLFIWVKIFFGAIYSLLSEMFAKSAIELPALSAFLYFFGSIVLMAISLYAFAICFRLIALKTRVFKYGI